MGTPWEPLADQEVYRHQPHSLPLVSNPPLPALTVCRLRWYRMCTYRAVGLIATSQSANHSANNCITQNVLQHVSQCRFFFGVCHGFSILWIQTISLSVHNNSMDHFLDDPWQIHSYLRLERLTVEKIRLKEHSSTSATVHITTWRIWRIFREKDCMNRLMRNALH